MRRMALLFLFVPALCAPLHAKYHPIGSAWLEAKAHVWIPAPDERHIAPKLPEAKPTPTSGAKSSTSQAQQSLPSTSLNAPPTFREPSPEELNSMLASLQSVLNMPPEEMDNLFFVDDGEEFYDDDVFLIPASNERFSSFINTLPMPAGRR